MENSHSTTPDSPGSKAESNLPKLMGVFGVVIGMAVVQFAKPVVRNWFATDPPPKPVPALPIPTPPASESPRPVIPPLKSVSSIAPAAADPRAKAKTLVLLVSGIRNQGVNLVATHDGNLDAIFDSVHQGVRAGGVHFGMALTYQTRQQIRPLLEVRNGSLSLAE